MKDNLRIYHNPRCSKSRAALELLEERGFKPEVIEYLKTPPGKEELRAVLKTLGLRPQDIVRRGEDVFKAEYAGRELDDEAWLDALVAHPILIERPIVVRGKRAVVGRSTEKVLELL
jgi:arsenate reductase